MYDHILIPTDGSELAQKGVDHGLSLAKRLGSRATIISVTEPFPRSIGAADGWVPSAQDIEKYREANRAHALTLLETAKEAADAMGTKAEILHIEASHPGTAIVEQAKKLGCSLIVMSSHGRRGLSRMLLGSQTSEVLAHAPIPVLVVR